MVVLQLLTIAVNKHVCICNGHHPFLHQSMNCAEMLATIFFCFFSFSLFSSSYIYRSTANAPSKIACYSSLLVLQLSTMAVNKHVCICNGLHLLNVAVLSRLRVMALIWVDGSPCQESLQRHDANLCRHWCQPFFLVCSNTQCSGASVGIILLPVASASNSTGILEDCTLICLKTMLSCTCKAP